MKSYPETMVAESAGENSFKIGLLVFEILHNQYFPKPYLLSFNPIVMLFSVVNGKTFPEHEVEKIFQIEQAVQKLWPYFYLYVNVTQ